MPRFVRDWFTDELIEVPYTENVVTTSRKSPSKRNAWDSKNDFVCKAMSLKPEDATPSRVEAENEAAKKHGTGAWYDMNGRCHLPTRGSRSREMRRRGFMDLDAGYGDWAGH